MSSATTLIFCCALLCTLPRIGHAQPPSDDEAQAAPEPDAAGGDVIEYANGRLTVDVVEMPLQTVLREVGKQTGARIQAQDLETTMVTDEFTALPLDAAIRRLVAGRNFTLIYASEPGANGKQAGRRLKELQVFGEPAAGRPPSRPAAPARVSPAAARKPAPRAGAAPAPKPGRAAAKPVQSPQVAPAGTEGGAASGGAQAEGADATPPPAPLANPVSAAIVGGVPEPAEHAPEEEPWVQGHEGEVPVYDDGFGAEVETYDEGFDEGAYGGELEEGEIQDGEVEPFEER
jgi:hypothetical protein